MQYDAKERDEIVALVEVQILDESECSGPVKVGPCVGELSENLIILLVSG